MYSNFALFVYLFIQLSKISIAFSKLLVPNTRLNTKQ